MLTLAGGLLFGWLLGGIASMIGATLGAVIVFLIARSALSEVLAARAGPWLDRFREGFKQDAFNYLLFLQLVPIFPFWLVNLAPGLLGVSFATYLITTILGIIPGTFAYSLAGSGLDSIIAAQQSAHQSCLAKMGPGGQEFLPVCARSWGAFDAGADCWARGAWARRPRAGRGQVVQAEGGLRGQG